MRRPYVSKRLFLLLSVVFLILASILIFSAGCNQTGANISEKISDKEEKNAEKETDKQTGSGFPEGFPESVPVYPGADIVESVKNEVDGKMTYKIVLQCKGDIEKLSDWYRQSLEKGWSVGSVSEGDMGDWSEFYAEAQNGSNFLIVYLYQEEGSDDLSIDLTVRDLAEGEAVAENTQREAAEDQEGNITEESTEGYSQSYSGALEDASIAFVCASVGSAWNIGEHFTQLNIKVYDEYQFDKGYRIQDILDSEKPDIMIIKECAAYFPPDYQGSTMSAYQDLIRDWVNLCRGQGVIPVLTTVVPIDPNTNEGQPQLNAILEFNDWIKQYCSDEDISVLDLEAALHISNTNRALDPVYDSGDGLHPNEIAYTEKLDNILIPALERALEIGY